MPTESMIGEHREEHLLGVAQNTVVTKTKESRRLDVEAERRIPKFDFSELKLGKVLGRGGFCVVHEIVSIALSNKLVQKEETVATDSNEAKSGVRFGDGDDPHDEPSQFQNIVQDRGFMANNYIREGKDYRYAIKLVQDSCRKDASLFVNAVVDLAVEARFLSIIRHSNIIKMRAMSCNSPYDGQFFVVLDRLYDTLTVRMQKWKKSKVTGIKKLMDRKGFKSMAFYMERVTVAYDLACALKYMHELNIIYRDIKPDNIGFDVRGDVKIFDFGLVKEFDPNKRDPKSDLFHFTADTGSPRYMSPEVALGQPYDERVDVYSFCILIWQMLSLETPFEGYNMNSMKRSVYEGGARPKPDEKKWSSNICNMLRSGWCSIDNRVSMEQIYSSLRNEINSNSEYEVSENVDASYKSVASVRGNKQKA